MESGQRHKLKFVAHGAELALEALDLCIGELCFPVERRRAVVRKQLAWELGMDGFREHTRLLEVGLGSFAPDHVRIRSVGEAASYGRIETAANSIEPLHCAFAGEEL